MCQLLDLKQYKFLVYGLGSTGKSVVNYFKKNKIKNFFVWDDKVSLKNEYKNKTNINIKKILKEVDFIVLSPGVSLINNKTLSKFKKKIITDIDLLYLNNANLNSIIITGSNGKSTTSKIIAHLLKKNKINVNLCGNIGTPVLSVVPKKQSYYVIEASSFQLSHSKFVCPNYAIILNITNDHLDWHGSFKSYKESKFKVFKLQKKNDYALLNHKLIKYFKKKKYLSKLISLKDKEYKKIKSKIKNDYLMSYANNENMKFVFTISKLFKIKKKSFIDSMNSFLGLEHRQEKFLKRNDVTFINDSKATSFQATKFALSSYKNIFWILGGLHKPNDKFNLKKLKKNIVKSYIIGKKINYFKKQLKNKIKIEETKNLAKAITLAIKDIKFFGIKNSTILLSPGAASFDQFDNFEDRGNKFKTLSKYYAKKFL